jgi:ferredoxin
MLLPLCLEASSHARAMMVTMCDLPDREARIDALWSEAAESAAEEPNTKDPSHLYIAMDEESGEPVAARFTYVDEHSCIGCTYCATTARSTFFLEEDHGRARVFDQAGDSEELIQEAIDSCPVNCIHYVSYEDLVILETERAGQFINNAARLRSQQEGTAFVPESKATNFMTGSMRCTSMHRALRRPRTPDAALLHPMRVCALVLRA